MRRIFINRGRPGVGATLAVAAVLAAGCASEKPEPLALRDARMALQDAKNARADQLAAGRYEAARAHLSTAEVQWRQRKDAETAVHYAHLADSEARDAQFRAVARSAEESIDLGKKRRAELEIAVRDAEIKASAAKARSEAERQRAEAEIRLRQQRERTEATISAREAEQRASDEKTRALQAQLDAERRKAEDQQRQAEIDRLRGEIEEQKKAVDATRRAADEQVAAAQRAAEEERARADEARRQAAEREKGQADLLIRLQEIEKSTRVETRGIVVTLPGNVYFDSGRSDVKAPLRDRLADIAKALVAAPDRRLVVEGHTDSTGTVEFNMKLSELRAEAVKAVLVANGVSPDRIEIHGYGPTKPLASNTTASGKSQNRRVEVVIQGGPGAIAGR